MLRKLPGLIWTVTLIAYLVKRFAPPEAITSLIERVRAAMSPPAPVPSTNVSSTSAPPAASNGADLHTPLPVA